MVWTRVGLDVVHMPWSRDGFKYVVFARDDLSGWVEGRALQEMSASNVARFFLEDVIYRHGTPVVVMMDRGKENMKETQGLLAAFQAHQIRTLSPSSQRDGRCCNRQLNLQVLSR